MQERFPKSWARRTVNGVEEYFVWCSRKRCETRIPLFMSSYEEKQKYPDNAVVVSLNDGAHTPVFCSEKCAAQWLSAYTRKMKDGNS